MYRPANRSMNGETIEYRAVRFRGVWQVRREYWLWSKRDEAWESDWDVVSDGLNEATAKEEAARLDATVDREIVADVCSSS